MSTLDRPCEDWLERVSAHLDGESGEAEDRAVREHLDSCPDCRAWADAVKADAERFAATYGRAAEQVDVRAQALDRIAASARRPRRWGTLARVAVAGVLGLMALALMLPVVIQAPERWRKSICVSNQKQILTAAIAFAQDSDGRLPRAVAWNAHLIPYLKDAEEVFRCPSAHPRRNAGYDYAYNSGLSDKPTSAVAQPADAVMIFDADDGNIAWRHQSGAIFGYADGHVRWQPQADARRKAPTTTEPGRALSIPVGVQAVPRGS